MAFRDELTGIPSRRALNEQLAALGNRYAIAMLDVDHFKKFNDTYGHDLGDQVLKMVAAHIARVGGGGKAFRYGGEEFTVLFPGTDAEDAIPHLEALREEIESYRMALRGSDRPARTQGQEAPARRVAGEERGVGDGEHRRGGTQRALWHSASGDRGRRPRALPRQGKRPQPVEPIDGRRMRPSPGHSRLLRRPGT